MGKYHISLKKIWFYNFVYFPPFSGVYFVSLFKCVNIYNINVHCLFICLCLSFFFKINFHLVTSLGFCREGFIDICLFSHCRIFSIFIFVFASVSSSSISSIICFLSKKPLIPNSFIFEWPTQCDVLSPLFM